MIKKLSAVLAVAWWLGFGCAVEPLEADDVTEEEVTAEKPSNGPVSCGDFCAGQYWAKMAICDTQYQTCLDKWGPLYYCGWNLKWCEEHASGAYQGCMLGCGNPVQAPTAEN